MADFFIGQIIAFTGDFAPEGFVPCDGRLLPIDGYEALFSLIGTAYGGDGIKSFAVPDLRGAIPMNPVALTGARVREGQTEYVLKKLPSHSHTLEVTNDAEEIFSATMPQSSFEVTVKTYRDIPAHRFPHQNILSGLRGSGPSGVVMKGYAADPGASPGELAGVSVRPEAPMTVTGSAKLVSLPNGDPSFSTESSGQGRPFTVIPPVLGVNFLIAVKGEYPTEM